MLMLKNKIRLRQCLQKLNTLSHQHCSGGKRVILYFLYSTLGMKLQSSLLGTEN